MIIEIKKDK